MSSPTMLTVTPDLVRSISDPEHTQLTLEELHVVNPQDISITGNHLQLEFTPTVPHCGMSTLIGLSLRVRLLRSLPQRFKIDIKIKPGTHVSENTRKLNIAPLVVRDSYSDLDSKPTIERQGESGSCSGE